MEALSHMARTDAVYGAATRAKVRIRLIPFPLGEKAFRLRASFPRPDGFSLTSPIEIAGQRFRRAVWRINGALSRASDIGLGNTADELETLQPDIEATGGRRQAHITAQAVEVLRLLDDSPENPLGDALAQAMADLPDSQVTLIVPSAESAGFALRWLKDLPADAEVIQRGQVSKAILRPHTLVIGTPQWYPSALITAPRSEILEFIQFDWLSYPRSVEGLLPVESTGVSRPIEVRGKSSANPPLDPVDLPPSPNWSAIAEQRGVIQEGDRRVMARPVLLSDDHAVLLSNEPGARVTCAVPADGRVSVEHLEVGDLSPGVFILIRTLGSDSDFIGDIADRRFGAKPLRAQLEVWKQRLRRVILEHGANRVSSQLRQLGAQTANVRYWASPDTIRPRSHHDFRILLEFLGFAEMGPTLMAAADEVFGAHIEAGHCVRQLLEDRLAHVELTSGTQIALDEGDGGELSVFQVVQLSDLQFEVGASALGEPFPVEEAAWLA